MQQNTKPEYSKASAMHDPETDAAAEEGRRPDDEQKKINQARQKQKKQQQRALRKALLAVAAFALVAAVVVFFVTRPGANYAAAAGKFAAGDYQAARDGYRALGDYQDAAARVLLCDAMIDLRENRPEDAAAKLDQLIGEGHGELAGQLSDTLLSVTADWKGNGLSPQTLLFLLGKADRIDPNGTLDLAALTAEGHMALLDGTHLSAYADDVNGDGLTELIALNPDYSIAVYRMTADGNVRMAVGNEIAAACAAVFGNQYKETDIDASVACFAEAYRLLPNDGARSALTAAYQQRSADYENAGDMDAAIADARSALETAGTAEAFSFFYDINLRHCKNGREVAAAIAMWDDFAADSAIELARFSAKSRWQSDAAQLHLLRAAELAAQKDEGCIEALRTAAQMGADITDAAEEAASRFAPGLSLARLRLMEIELLGADDAKAQEIRAHMADEVRAAISEWSARGILPADVPALIRLADEQSIDLSGVDRDAIYEQAAIASAGNAAQHAFVDWNADGYKELLTLDASGKLSLYGTDETWKIVSSIDTKLPASSYAIPDEGAPLVLVLAPERDAFLAVDGTNGNLRALFRETGISRLRINGSSVFFSRSLEGSIARYCDYLYEAVSTENRPGRTSIDWQQHDYPQPESAVAAVQRYFEARAYGISDEAAFLTGNASVSELFTADRLAALPAPDVPGTVNAAAYQTQEKRALFEVTYPAGAQNIRVWIAAEYMDGWKVTGAADTYGAGLTTDPIDYGVSLISLNAPVSHTLSAKGSRATYRLLIPSSGRIRLEWQHGSKAASRTSHTVTMTRGSLTGDSVFSYPLQPSPNLQISKDLFVSAGLYYVTVEANLADTERYQLTIPFTAEAHVELENNDTPAKATAAALNTGYYGALSSAKDIDYFSFALDAASAVNVTFAIPGNGSKTASHTITVLSAADGSKLSAVSVPGNAQLTETGNLYLSPGTYLVQAAKGSAFTNDAYILTVNADQKGYMEAEPNNTPETATAIPLNEDIHASIGQEGDTDYYTFTLEEDAVIQPRFTFTPTDVSSRTYVLTIANASRQELLKVNIGGKESTKVITPVALTAGTYTVKIENTRFVRQDYTLRLVSMAVAASEKEPNDSAALATVLAVGQPRTGVLSSGEDIDCYKVVFSEETIVTLRFSFAQSTKTEIAFVLTAEQNGKTQLTLNIKGDSGGVEKQIRFPAGEYYIKIKPSTAWLGTVYTFSLEQ